ncbi:MAG: diaminopimelate epimerase [Candidatus Marinimicrobia bacterium]|nr:diaminopimelate epimerase [Candidatus Neomarinimicrobiota bacterium]
MIPFTKAQGAGNDFVLFDAQRCPDIIRDPAFIQRVCNRHRGVGADGVMILSPPEDAGVDMHLDYHNADGSWETFCANGTRCAVAFAIRGEMVRRREIVVRTGAGDHRAELLPDGRVRLQILPPSHVTELMELNGFKGRQVDSGAPHFVIEVDDLSEALVAANGPALRHHAAFQPRGVNVDFFQRIDSQTLKVITYEKGVESVMLSCASGSTAACFQAARSGAMSSPIRVVNPGGELSVEFDDGWREVSVTGPAELVFDAQLPDDF